MSATRTRLLVGRGIEQLRLRTVVEQVQTKGVALVVVGAPGMGKTSLVDMLANDASDRGMTVLKTTGVQSEARLPFGGLEQLLRSILTRVDRLPESQRNTILGAVGQIDIEVGDFFAVALATLSLLRDQASKTPILVIAEDLQWLDRPTLDVLTFASRRIELDPIVIIATSRDALRDTPAEGGFVELTLTGLDEHTAGLIIDSHAPGLRPDLRRRLLEEASGNPLALSELAAAWITLPPKTRLETLVPVTERVEEAFAVRLHTLPATCRMVLLVAAIDDGDSVAEILKAVGSEPELPDLAPAIEAGLVELEGRSLRFRHPLVRSAVYHAATVTERLRAHAALAKVLDPDRAIWHRAASMLLPDEDVAARLEHTAMLARRRGTPLSAIGALERAAELSPSDPERGRRLLIAANLAFQLGRQEHAKALVQEAEELPLDSAWRLQATWLRLRLDSGDWHDVSYIAGAVGVAEQMVTTGEPDMALEVLMAICETGLMSFAKPHAQLLFSAIQKVPDVGGDPRWLYVLACCAPIEFNERLMARITETSTYLRSEPRAMSLLAVAAAFRGSWAVAARMLDGLIDPLREQGQFLLLRYVFVSRAFAAWHLGEWDLTTYMAGQASRLAEQTEISIDAGATLALGIVDAARGDTEAAEAIAIGTEQWARVNHVPGTLHLALYMRGCAALADGRFDEAYEHLAEVFAGDLSYQLVLNQGIATYFFDAAVQSGRPDGARDLLRKLEALPPGSDSPELIAAIAYARALLADDAAFDAAFDAAATLTAGSPFMHARLLLSCGVRRPAPAPAPRRRCTRTTAKRSRHLRRSRRHSLESTSPAGVACLRREERTADPAPRRPTHPTRDGDRATRRPRPDQP